MGGEKRKDREESTVVQNWNTGVRVAHAHRRSAGAIGGKRIYRKKKGENRPPGWLTCGEGEGSS